MESQQPHEVGPFHSDVSRRVLLHHQAIPAQQTTHRIRYTGSGQGSFNSLRHHRGAGSMSCLNGECRASHSARMKPSSKSCAGVELLKTCMHRKSARRGWRQRDAPSSTPPEPVAPVLVTIGRQANGMDELFPPGLSRTVYPKKIRLFTGCSPLPGCSVGQIPSSCPRAPGHLWSWSWHGVAACLCRI